jgi:transcriptional regulator with GAF, ATPase, and Fis domain
VCQRALRSGEAVYVPISDAAGAGSSARHAFAVPLTVDGRPIGVLYLQSRFGALIDESDVPVLHGVASHLALALDRERLAEQQRVTERREQAALKAALDRLRTVVPQAKLVFRSEAMVQLLDTTRRVAPTDATVLITGESGTGKEMLAHTLHTFSGRHSGAFVIVDCGAIPTSLIDSELFGRERGAYTGAERRTAGRLAQADGGTIFLDEIGELPLEVQAKLLRFVQEKTITMVGATSSQRVDVRIVAATNRALEDEVRAGRFREDLFHRLNVVRLQMPPLRERIADIQLLADHFLETFAVQFGKPVRGFDARAHAALLSQPWPGNVRELQNAVLQAVVLSQGEQLTPEDLIRTRSTGSTRLIEASRTAEDAAAPTPTAPADLREVVAHRAPADAEVRGAFETAWERLRVELSVEVQAAAAADLALPLGRWLEHDVVLLAYEWAGRVTSRAARRIGLAETTFSRHLRQAQADAAGRRQPDSWNGVRKALDVVVKTAGGVTGLDDQLQDLLLALVVASRTTPARAAIVLNISAPTLKRRLVAFHRRQSGLEACA